MRVPAFSGLADKSALAVGVSGGPDSMALAYLLTQWRLSLPSKGKKKGPVLHFLIVDHRLRLEAAQEAEDTAMRLTGICDHDAVVKILRRAKPKTKSRIQEKARHDRYDLFRKYMKKHNIESLLLAHHQDDQAETFFLRLAGGSGLDGLAAMRPVQGYEGIVLVRPLLSVPKDRLVATCRQAKLKYVQDSSNTDPSFARPRLRKARAVLEKEGLSAKRIAQTALRLDRARAALDEITEKAYKSALKENNSKRIVFKTSAVYEYPLEVAVRLTFKAYRQLVPAFSENGAAKAYGPRLEKLESLVTELLADPPFRKRTLGGVIFSRDDVRRIIVLERERKR